MSKAKTKDIRISLIRMLSTMMVVGLHICQQLEKCVSNLNIVTDWMNLGLVMFFCISAFLYSRRDIHHVFKWYGHRYFEIVLPAVVVSIITVIFFAIKGEITTQKVFAAIASGMGFESFLKNSWMFVQLWFLTYLLFFYLTLPIIQKIKCNDVSEFKFWTVFILVVALLQILSIVIEKMLRFELLSIGVLLRFYLPYFVIKRYGINNSRLKNIMVFFSLISILAITLTAYCRYVMCMGVISEIMFVYTQTLSGFVLFYWLYNAFSCLKNYNIILKLSDTYSYNIYLTHCLFIGYNTSLISLFSNKLVGILLALILTAVSSVMVRYLVLGIRKTIANLQLN